jgi:hypothetical protein
MKAVLLKGHGGFEQLEYRDDVPVAAPRAGEVLIRVGAAGVNNRRARSCHHVRSDGCRTRHLSVCLLGCRATGEAPRRHRFRGRERCESGRGRLLGSRSSDRAGCRSGGGIRTGRSRCSGTSARRHRPRAAGISGEGAHGQDHPRALNDGNHRGVARSGRQVAIHERSHPVGGGVERVLAELRKVDVIGAGLEQGFDP